MSFEIFIKATAQAFNDPERLTIASCAANAANLLELLDSGMKKLFLEMNNNDSTFTKIG